MPEVPRGNYCGRCQKNLVDISQLTPEQAIALLRSAKEETCIAYSSRSRNASELLLQSPSGTVAIVGVAALLAACSEQPENSLPLAPTAIAATTADRETEPVSTGSGRMSVPSPRHSGGGDRVWKTAGRVRLPAPFGGTYEKERTQQKETANKKIDIDYGAWPRDQAE